MTLISDLHLTALTAASLPIPAIPRAVQGLPVLGTPRMSPPWSPNSDPCKCALCWVWKSVKGFDI